MTLLPLDIETQRLHLRRYIKSDAQWYCDMALRNRSHLSRYESGNAAMRISNATDAETVITRFHDDAIDGKCCFLGIFLAGTDLFVGANLYWR